MAGLSQRLTLSQLQDLYLLFCKHSGLHSLTDSALGTYTRDEPVDRMYLSDWLTFVDHMRLERSKGQVAWAHNLTRAFARAAFFPPSRTRSRKAPPTPPPHCRGHHCLCGKNGAALAL
jgi:hypothetical protein